jgi:hypothetical protein
MREYLAKQGEGRPLSIAVFGPPGSGKSFGVKEIAENVSKNIVECSYNVSQFTSPVDLANALIQTRDTSIGGNKVPLIFFDEFDAMLEGDSLGWLKYFLSVMQDGLFRHGNTDLKVGQAICVFAGGTSRSYLEFTRKNASETEKTMFRLAKGPDFVSRLRGFVDILGPNRLLEPHAKDADDVFIIRRAIILRGLLERKYRHLINHSAGPLDENVAHALLNVWGYEHGTRSLEAVLEMSALATAERFEKSALPPKEQLSMHLSEHPQKPSEFDELLRTALEEQRNRRQE